MNSTKLSPLGTRRTVKVSEAIGNLLGLAKRMHYHCRDWEVYEQYKRNFQQLARDHREYETAMHELELILDL